MFDVGAFGRRWWERRRTNAHTVPLQLQYMLVVCERNKGKASQVKETYMKLPL